MFEEGEYADPRFVRSAFEQVKKSFTNMDHPFAQREGNQILFHSAGVAYTISFDEDVLQARLPYRFVIPSALEPYAREAMWEVNQNLKFVKCVLLRADNGDLTAQLLAAFPVAPAITVNQARAIVQTIVGALEMAWTIFEAKLPITFTALPEGGDL